MISVEIKICGRPIHYVDAVNVTEPFLPNDQLHTYSLGNGVTLKHRRDKGAIVLAIKMLKTLKDDWGTK